VSVSGTISGNIDSNARKVFSAGTGSAVGYLRVNDAASDNGQIPVGGTFSGGGSGTISGTATGGGSVHNNMQPTTFFNWEIKL